ncbi:pentatricopeptide repeat-containing protein [Quercus suber]|uniref:Pentatricopeptide repeat-containing protein n=1 Tax=Quercus suber TaxID=58331 RepID=A0AAW0KRD1_QUESU
MSKFSTNNPFVTCISLRRKNCAFEHSVSFADAYANKVISALNVAEAFISRNLEVESLEEEFQLDFARNLFDEMPRRTVVSWNTVISGYSKWWQYYEALKLTYFMHSSNIKLNETTFSTTLSVCARSQSVCEGEELHCLVLKSGFERFELLGSALLYLYASCIDIEGAKRVFDELHGENGLLWSLMLVQCNLMSDAFDVFNKMPSRDVMVWTTLISGYARSEDGCEWALELFRRMRGSGEVKPIEFTLASSLQEAEEFIKAMPIEADGVVWGALLSACWFWTKMELIGRVAEKIFNLDPKAVSAHVILSNTHSILGKWGEKMNVRKRLRTLGIKKAPGCSWIELESNVHVFSVEDRTHPHCNAIYATLEHLTPNINSLQYDFYFGFKSIVEADFFKAKYPY